MTVAAVPAASARVLHTVVQDDNLSLFSPNWLPQYVKALRWLGVDNLRISAEWKLEAPGADSSREPAGFQAGDPGSYNSVGMRLLDGAVRAAASQGLHVIIDPAFSAPLWATGDRATPRSHGGPWYRTNIDVRQLVVWETMLARRYSGHFIPAGQRVPLPKVETFTLWNEPNGQGFLAPQWRGRVPVSADWYRRLVQMAYPAMKRISRSITVLIGNTSDAGSDARVSRGGVPPLTFIRRLACVDARFRPVSDGACAHFRTLPGDGYAHHPYERVAPPWVATRSGRSGWVQMGDLPRLQAVLHELVAMHRLAPAAESLWLTEQGYESSAELRDRPWTEAQQSQLNAASEYLAWRDPHVLSFAQFLLRDSLTGETLGLRRRRRDPRAELAGTWTSGLLRQDFVPKPALSMFRSPVLARSVSPAHVPCTVKAQPRSRLEVIEAWGRARPASAPTRVHVQLSDGASGFRTLRNMTTDQSGIFDTLLTVPASSAVTVRFQWLAADGTWQTSPATLPLALPIS